MTAVFKDVLIRISVIAIIVAAVSAMGGDFSKAFTAAASKGANWMTVPNNLVAGYMTLVLGSALALYLYPHAVNGVLSTQSAHKLRLSTSFLPFYGIGLALLDLLGILIYAFPTSLSFLTHFPTTNRGIEVVPTLVLNLLPGWLAGIALLGIFIGGLVPAAIMAIAQENLLSRNIIKEMKPNLTEKAEVSIAKWGSAAFKFIALGFVFVTPITYAIQLQLLGGILIIQLLPALFLGLYTSWFKKQALIIGLLAGLASGLYFTLAANKFGTSAFSGLNTSLYSPFYGMYIAVIALAINLLVVIVLSAIIPRKVSPVQNIAAKVLTVLLRRQQARILLGWLPIVLKALPFRVLKSETE